METVNGESTLRKNNQNSKKEVSSNDLYSFAAVLGANDPRGC